MRSESEGQSLETPRKLLKPQVEKRRRERINHSLEKLRVLLSQTMTNEKLKNPKMEKAEILEYTVQFLQSRMMPSEMFNEELSQEYQSGFQGCLQTTVHLINSNQQLSHVSKDFLFQQLSTINLLETSSTADHNSGHHHRLLPPVSNRTSTWHNCPNNIPLDHTNNIVDIQSGWFSDQTSRSWRPWV